MTVGTSPRPPVTLFINWTETARGVRNVGQQLAARVPEAGRSRSWLGKAVAASYLGGLGVLLTTAWHPAIGAEQATGGFPAWHLAFLMATGAAAALLTLTRRESEGAEESGVEAAQAATAGVSELMAQMSHELRTPLNAVIGFSEVMLHQLHGPLGNARYQEYAHHISESGGRLLRSSEEALAVTEAMTALMADRGRIRRERLGAGTLAREGWKAAMNESDGLSPRLVTKTCSACEIVGERRPIVQALQHLFREGLERSGGGDKERTIEVIGRRRGGSRSIEIRTPTAVSEEVLAANGLRIILARLLLGTQGATLTCRNDGSEWSALIEFSARA